ncbi:hypothetical protein [Bacillus paranthracis]|uniref:hypothetical protein n=2 Tax=cellular organisms TaxID=131567 RepID=UPI00240862AB|nr:hypothetical protein [Bacillus paranthracis]MDG0912396.1 hypothetical protein [Bacillus paranthracis]
MKFKEGEDVIVDHPDYPESKGLARVIRATSKILWVELHEQKGEWMVHEDFLRKSTNEGKEETKKSSLKLQVKL